MKFSKKDFEKMVDQSSNDANKRFNQWFDGSSSDGLKKDVPEELQFVEYWKIIPDHPNAFFAYLSRYDLFYDIGTAQPYRWRHHFKYYLNILDALSDLEFTYDEMMTLFKSNYPSYARCIHTIADNSEMFFLRPNGDKFMFRVEITPYPTKQFLAQFLVGYGNTKEEALWAALEPIRDQGYIERNGK